MQSILGYNGPLKDGEFMCYMMDVRNMRGTISDVFFCVVSLFGLPLQEKTSAPRRIKNVHRRQCREAAAER